MPKRDLAFKTAYHWIFDRKIPSSEEEKRALALYREARNAEQNFMVSYAVLNFVKVIEVLHPEKKLKKWFRDHFVILEKDPNHSDVLNRFTAIRGNEKHHIWTACRVAVAHASKDFKSDPDDATELARLHVAAEVLRILARHFITTELRISDVMYSGN